MDDIMDQVLELSVQGLCCSQILMKIVGLDLQGKENPDLLSVMGAYCYGIYNQLVCGALSGGAGALCLHIKEKVQRVEFCNSLVTWFEETYGCTNCSDILGKGNPPAPVCKEIIAKTIEKCLDMLDKRL